MIWAVTSEARAEPQNRPGVLGDVGLEKRNLHLAIARQASLKSINKSLARAELVHCTLLSR